MALDVITMGSSTIDLFVHTDQSEIIDIRSRDGSKEFITYPAGGKMLITELRHNIGGNGANSAVAIARLGLKAGYLGKIGNDHNGKIIINSLKKEKVKFVGSKGKESGLSIILDSIEEDRTILAYKGCNNDLKEKEINFNNIKCKWLYLSTMLGESLKAMKSLAVKASLKGILISFNPSSTMISNDCSSALELLKYAKIVVLNKEEAEGLVGLGTIEDNLKKISFQGPEIVVITDGKNGAFAYHKNCFYSVKPAKNLKVVETTGAGDAFASTLTVGIIMKKPFDVCLKMAVINAESVISNHGSQNNLLSMKELMKCLKKDSRKIIKNYKKE